MQNEFEVLAGKIKKETLQKVQLDIAVRGAVVSFAQTLLTVASIFAILRFGMNMPYREISAEEMLIVKKILLLWRRMLAAQDTRDVCGNTANNTAYFRVLKNGI